MNRSGPARCRHGRCGLLCELGGEGGRRQIAEAGMRPHRVVVPAPGLDDHLRLGARAEPFEAEAFVAELAVDGMDGPCTPSPA